MQLHTRPDFKNHLFRRQRKMGLVIPQDRACEEPRQVVRVLTTERISSVRMSRPPRMGSSMRACVCVLPTYSFTSASTPPACSRTDHGCDCACANTEMMSGTANGAQASPGNWACECLRARAMGSRSSGRCASWPSPQGFRRNPHGGQSPCSQGLHRNPREFSIEI